ncbi:MAG: TauD/TfdA family dioxygenase [Rhodobacteraceae bacterium]|nr:TauD/TfdA family dioxygenase [Paracoccaceae bacterium]
MFNWSSLSDPTTYIDWRSNRLKAAEMALNQAPVVVSDLSNPGESAVSELKNRCDAANFALYTSVDSGDVSGQIPPVGNFAAAFGLQIAEAHRSADGTGVVALRVTDKAAQRGFIPYSSRAMNWHTDGYYNPTDARISAFILHCVRPADDGGVNQIFNPEILYIRLRDISPDYIRALMHPAVMTIPQNIEPDGSIRPVSVGPVFYGDARTGRLQMRYTARTRSISWNDEPVTQEAIAAITEILAANDPLMMQVALKAGQGILTNNALHNRTQFQNETKDAGRLMIRVRFHNRVQRKT